MLQYSSNIPEKEPSIKIHYSAMISYPINVGYGTFIHEQVEIGSGVAIGSHVVINGCCYIEDGCKIGNNVFLDEDCLIKGDSVIKHRCILGRHSIIGFSSILDEYCNIGYQAEIRRYSKIGKGIVIPPNATISSNSNLYVQKDFIYLGNVGNDCGVLVLARTREGVRLSRGCSSSMTLEEFKERIFEEDNRFPKREIYIKTVDILYNELKRRMTRIRKPKAVLKNENTN